MPTTSYDIVFAPGTIAYFTQQLHVVKRGLPHESRTGALLKYLRDEIDLTVDPLDMYSSESEYTLGCGCELTVTFEPQKVTGLARWRTGERSVPVAQVFRQNCATHAGQQDPFGGDEWDGKFAAWTHDPRRPAVFDYTGG